MAHTISERRRRERLKELDPKGWREQHARPRRELRHAKLIVAIWNKRAQRGRRTSYFPTIATAIAAKAPILEVLCPGCRTIGRVDLCEHDLHPAAPISALILRLS